MPGLDTDRGNLTLAEAISAIAALAWQENECPQSERATDWGRFEGDLLVKFLDDGRLCELVNDYVYVRSTGGAWPVAAGATVDGASIPRLLWPLIGGPFEGKYRNASIIHDFYCANEERPWRATHRMFYEAMRCAGVGTAQAKIMYYSVYRFGPRWSLAAQPRLESLAPSLTDHDAASLLADAEAIFVHDLSIEETERLADARNASSMGSESVPIVEGRGAGRSTRDS